MEKRADDATPHTTSLVTTQETNQVRQVDSRLNMVYPNETPFLALTNRLTTVSDGKAKKFEWGQQSDAPRRVTVSAEVAAAGTTIVVTPAAAVVAHEVLQDERTGEDIYITANTSGSLTVGTRGSYGGGTPAILPAGLELLIVGSAKEENADHSNPKAITPDLLYNYYQTLERVIASSTLAKAIEYYLGEGGQVGQDAIDAMRDFKRQMEMAILFGNRLDGTGPNSGKLYKVGGFRYFCEAYDNIHDVGGQFTYPDFMDLMSYHARVGGGGDYFGFASTAVCNIMQRWQLDYQRSDFMAGTTKKFGLDFLGFKGTNYNLMLVHHEAFEDSDVLGEQLYIAQASNNIRRYLRGLSPKTHKGIESPENTGKHGYIDQITATMTFQPRLPEANCIIKGIHA